MPATIEGRLEEKTGNEDEQDHVRVHFLDQTGCLPNESKRVFEVSQEDSEHQTHRSVWHFGLFVDFLHDSSKQHAHNDEEDDCGSSVAFVASCMLATLVGVSGNVVLFVMSLLHLVVSKQQDLVFEFDD